MSSSLFARNSILAVLLAGAASLPAKAQPAPEREASPSTENTLGPGIHDNGGCYSEQDRQKIAEIIADLYKRYRCYVLIETCESAPDGAGDIDLKDSAAVDHALGVWRQHLVQQADKRNTVFSFVLAQSKEGGRYNWWMGYGIFSKEEGDEINHEVFHQLRSGMPNALNYLGRAIARKQRAPKREAPPSTENTIGPGIHDTCGYYSEQDRQKIAEIIADLYKRYRCYVLIETCEGAPDGAGEIDLKDSAAVDHALGVWRQHLVQQADKRNTVFSFVLAQSKEGGRYNWWMGYGIFSKEEGDEINHEVFHQLRSGMPNALNYLGRAIARKQSRQVKTREQQERAKQEAMRNDRRDAPPSAVELKTESDRRGLIAFRETAMAGGLSAAEQAEVTAARGSVSYETLTDFAKGQIKESRKGKDLKDDLLTFIKLVNEKK